MLVEDPPDLDEALIGLDHGAVVFFVNDLFRDCCVKVGAPVADHAVGTIGDGDVSFGLSNDRVDLDFLGHGQC